MPTDRPSRPATAQMLTRRLLAVVGLLLAVGLSPAAAQDGADRSAPPEADEQIVHSWALAPTGTDPAEPGSRPYLDYQLAPGADLDDSVTLWNYSNVQLTFRIYATDAVTNPDGAFDLIAPDTEPTDVGTWIELPQGYVTVPAATSMELPITVRVPAGASPGDHVGAIVAETAVGGTGSDGSTVTLNRRTGSRIYLRVDGALDPLLEITSLDVAYAGRFLAPTDGTVTVEHTISNVGNIRLDATQRVVLKDLFGRVVAEAPGPDITELLPGNELHFTHRFDDITAAVRLRAEVVLEPGLDHEEVHRSASTWAIPWLLLPIALLAVAALRSGRRWWRRRRPNDGEPDDGPAEKPVADDDRPPVLVQ